MTTKLPKFMQKMLDSQGDAPRILVKEWKHGITYHDATGEKLFAVALEILRLHKDEWHYIPSVETAKKWLAEAKAAVDMPKELAESLPESIRAEAMRIAEYQAAQVIASEDLLHAAREAERAVEENDGRLAWMILNDRRGYEYEKIELHVLQQPGE